MAASGARVRAIRPDNKSDSSTAVVVEAGALAHTALLYPIDANGALQGGADARAQATFVLDQLSTVLASAGTGVDRIARLHVYVADATATPAVAQLLSERFAEHPPAVTIVESRMPKAGVLVAMDAVAATARPKATTPSERIVVTGVAAMADRSAHVSVQPEGPWAIVSGRAAPGEFDAAVRGTMEQLRGDLQAVNLGFDHVVQVKAFLGDMSRADQLLRIVARTFQGTAPPLVVTEWRSGSLPVEIELVATAPGAAGRERLTLVEPISARYSRVARIYGGRPIFVSGLTGTSPDPAAQVREVFDQLRQVLAEAGSDIRHLAKATYYVSDTTADQEINTIRPTIYDHARPPAASKISVQGTGRPGKAVVIDMIAVTAAR